MLFPICRKLDGFNLSASIYVTCNGYRYMKSLQKCFKCSKHLYLFINVCCTKNIFVSVWLFLKKYINQIQNI